MQRELTLGSLFDGIGGFCYAAYLTGRIKPVCAAEIEPNCIDITRYRFPEVMHVGSVTELKGDEIQPVDIITFGSPCQDLSIAGQRKGLKGNRSGLFMEAVRIIEEMRLATDGKYPAFIIWENVPGAFSSRNGADFRTVLEKITKAGIPMPAGGRWAGAGMVRGAEADTAWRTLDAQFWGVPQRRKRIYLVGDFGGQRAGEILFKSESMLGYTAEGREQGQETAGQPADGTGTECSRREKITGMDFSCRWDAVREFTDKAPALTRKMGTGGENVPCVDYRKKRNVMPLRDEAARNAAGNGLGVGKAGDPCPTLTAADMHGVFYEAYQHSGYRESRISGTITADLAKMVSGSTPVVVHAGRNISEPGLHQEHVSGGAESIKSILKRTVQKITYVIRRLTPVECERLQGYPDNWTKYGAGGTEISDTARYRAIGNSICVYCAERVYLGILYSMEEEADKDDGRMG